MPCHSTHACKATCKTPAPRQSCWSILSLRHAGMQMQPSKNQHVQNLSLRHKLCIVGRLSCDQKSQDQMHVLYTQGMFPCMQGSLLLFGCSWMHLARSSTLVTPSTPPTTTPPMRGARSGAHVQSGVSAGAQAPPAALTHPTLPCKPLQSPPGSWLPPPAHVPGCLCH